MFDLNELAKAVNEGTQNSEGHTMLVYGDPKTGKTRLAATVAKLPWVRHVHYVDYENGKDALVTMARSGVLTPAEASKVKVYTIRDTPDKSRAMEFALKGIVAEKTLRLCSEHGKDDCLVCFPTKPWSVPATLPKYVEQITTFDVKTLTHDDWLIQDSGTQLAASCMAHIMLGKGYDTKPGWDEYGAQGRMLSDIFSYVQAAARCNHMIVTHQMVLENNELEKKDKFYPAVGTKNYSLSVAKYFGTVIRLDLKMRKHQGVSASNAHDSIISGSRLGMKIEDEAELDFSTVWPKLGLKRPDTKTNTAASSAVKP